MFDRFFPLFSQFSYKSVSSNKLLDNAKVCVCVYVRSRVSYSGKYNSGRKKKVGPCDTLCRIRLPLSHSQRTNVPYDREPYTDRWCMCAWENTHPARLSSSRTNCSCNRQTNYIRAPNCCERYKCVKNIEKF